MLKQSLFWSFFTRVLVILITIVLCSTCIPAYAASTGLGPKVIDGGMCDFLWPVPGETRLSGCFYDKRNHYALDIFTETKKDVVASYDGTVIEVVKNGSGDAGYGSAVMIEHKYTNVYGKTITLYTRYAHLSSYSVKKGQVVSKGDVIGKTGGTGNGGTNTYPIHLDYQILTSTKWKKRETCSIDPFANYLLELPNGVKQGGTTPCCNDYIKQVKKKYKNYYWSQCTFYKGKGTIVISKATTIKSLPCSRDTNSQSADVKSAKKNQRYSVLGVIKNSAGNYWYMIGSQVNSQGYPIEAVVGYVFSGSATPVLNGWNGYYAMPDGKTLKRGGGL